NTAPRHAPRRACEAEPQPREEVAETEARVPEGSRGSRCRHALGAQAVRPESGEVDAARQAIRPRAQEAPQGSRPGEGLLGAEEVLVPLREGAGRALARLRLP